MCNVKQRFLILSPLFECSVVYCKLYLGSIEPEFAAPFPFFHAHMIIIMTVRYHSPGHRIHVIFLYCFVTLLSKKDSVFTLHDAKLVSFRSDLKSRKSILHSCTQNVIHHSYTGSHIISYRPTNRAYISILLNSYCPSRLAIAHSLMKTTNMAEGSGNFPLSEACANISQLITFVHQ